MIPDEVETIEWRGWLIESKSFMSYTELNTAGKVWFWVRWPIATAKFYWWNYIKPRLT